MTVRGLGVAPSAPDAERAAEALASAGVPLVLLYGSVARGEQQAGSDIDLIAVFDDLDYSTRQRRKADLGALASEAAGQPVQVRVTDRPEWEHRSRRLRTSFEAGVASYAVALRDRPPSAVHWGKEIGMATSDFGEAVGSLHNTNTAIQTIDDSLEPSRSERAALAERDADEYLAAVRRRLLGMCSAAQSALENSLKALVHLHCEEPPPRTHYLDDLAAALPERPRAEAAAAMECLDLAATSLWRERGTYPADFPDLPLEELTRTAHNFAAAACSAAALAARHIDAAARPGSHNTPRPAAKEIKSALAMCSRIRDALDLWDFTRPSPAAQMGIPQPPEPH